MVLPDNERMRVSTFLIEPVGGSCNLVCGYCYHSNIRRRRTKVMSREILARVTAEVLKSNEERVKFLWHGGEPMLAGMDFFRQEAELQKKFRKSESQIIDNHIQTNATLIDGKWARFFKEVGFRVSTSIDGPKRLHDQYRKNRSGQGSFEKVVAGINAVRQTGMDVGVVATINRFNVNFPEEVYETMMKLELKGFELNLATDAIGAEPLAPPAEDAVRFLRRVFDIWFDADDPTIHIRLFVNVLRSFVGLPVRDCSFSYNRCREYIACDEKGGFYTCGRFLKQPEAYLGSCMSGSLVDLLNSDSAKETYRKVSLISGECRNCRWLSVCGGGCAHQRWLNGGFGAPFPQCGIRRHFFEYIKERVGDLSAYQTAMTTS